jgi:3-hydroxy-9,10-secoandrosta-1,3,5(10)-triene-9,17-dione monooxygenase
MPEKTIQELVESGLVRLMQPLRWNGHELGFDALVSTGIEIGKACGSSGWCHSVLAIHFWMMSLFPERAQQDVWGKRSDTLIGTAVAPVGQPTRVDGGFRLSGNWPFASGIDYCEWAILGGLLPPREAGGHPEMRFFLVPKQDYTIDDTWYATGLRGTGSSNVVLDNVFVPEHRTVSVRDLGEGNSPGAAVNTAPLYRLPLLALFPFTLVGPAIGVALGALEVWRDRSRSRRSALTGAPFAEMVATHMRLGEAAVEIDCAELLIRRDIDDVMKTMTSGEKVPPGVRARTLRDAAYAARLCVRAVDGLFEASGGHGLYDKHPIQRAWRDVHAMSAHVALSWDTASENFGRMEFGLPSKLPF